jgi:hypothetical protein
VVEKKCIQGFGGENLEGRAHFAELHVCQGITKKDIPRKYVEWVGEAYVFD